MISLSSMKQKIINHGFTLAACCLGGVSWKPLLLPVLRLQKYCRLKFET